MKPTPADGLTIQELIAIAKKCRKKIAFAQGMQYAIKQERLGINSHSQASEMLRKHKARLKEVTSALERQKGLSNILGDMSSDAENFFSSSNTFINKIKGDKR